MLQNWDLSFGVICSSLDMLTSSLVKAFFLCFVDLYIVENQDGCYNIQSESRERFLSLEYVEYEAELNHIYSFIVLQANS